MEQKQMISNSEIKYEDSIIKKIMTSTETIALFVISENEIKQSFFAAT